MSTEHPSQPAVNPFADAAIPMLAALLEMISASSELTETKKTARKTSIRTVGRAIGLPLSAIPAHLAFLREKLADISPARIGLKRSSWANARSLLTKALREQGIDLMPGRYLAPISPSWLSLWKQMPERPTRSP